MLDLEVVNDFVYEFFSLVSISKNSEHWHARCVLCGDSKKNSRKKRFHLDYNKGSPIWQCFNCGRSGSFLELYSELKGLSISDSKNELFGFETIKDRLSVKKTTSDIKIENRINSQNFNYIREKSVSRNQKVDGILLSKYKETLNDFISNRKIPPIYDILICYDGDFKGRIIIPILDNDNNIIYFQARRLPGSNIQPKYINPNVEKSMIVLNENKFDENKDIIITEGLIDAFMIGNQGTACLGGFFSDNFIETIKNYTKKNIILAFDNPFIDDAGYKNLIKFMMGDGGKKQPSKFSKIVKYFLPDTEHRDAKDINILSIKYNIEEMYNYILNNSYSYTSTYSKLRLNRRK